MGNKYPDLSSLIRTQLYAREQGSDTVLEDLEQGREGWRMAMKGQVEINQHRFQGAVKILI